MVCFFVIHDVTFTPFRLIRLYEEDGKAHNGVPSIQRAVFRYIRTRMIASSVIVSFAVSAAVIGPVSKPRYCHISFLCLNYKRLVLWGSIVLLLLMPCLSTPGVGNLQPA